MGCALDHGLALLLGTDIMGDTFEWSFHLAEEVSEVNEVLITKKFRDRMVEDDALPLGVRMSDERSVEHQLHGQIPHHNLVFS